MKLSKQKELLKTSIDKLKKSRDFGSSCKLSTEESELVLKIMTDTAIRISHIQEAIDAN